MDKVFSIWNQVALTKMQIVLPHLYKYAPNPNGTLTKPRKLLSEIGWVGFSHGLIKNILEAITMLIHTCLEVLLNNF